MFEHVKPVVAVPPSEPVAPAKEEEKSELDETITSEMTCATSTDSKQISYKDQVCRAFKKKGYCAYGKRCRYAHPIPKIPM